MQTSQKTENVFLELVFAILLGFAIGSVIADHAFAGVIDPAIPDILICTRTSDGSTYFFRNQGIDLTNSRIVYGSNNMGGLTYARFDLSGAYGDLLSGGTDCGTSDLATLYSTGFGYNYTDFGGGGGGGGTTTVDVFLDDTPQFLANGVYMMFLAIFFIAWYFKRTK